MTEGTHGLERLRGQTSLREILEVATSFERSARDFYTDLIPKVSKRIRYLVEEGGSLYDLDDRFAKCSPRAAPIR